MRPNYSLQFTDKNFPSLSPAQTTKPPNPTGNQNQPQPVMATKPVATADVLGPSSQDALPPGLFGPSSASSSSSSSTSSISSAPSTTAALPSSSFPDALAQSQNTIAILGLEKVASVTSKIDEFQLTPSYGRFLEISQLLKDLKENIHFQKLKTNPQYQPQRDVLAKRIGDFWAQAQSSIDEFVKNKRITLRDIAKISYSLIACIQLDADNGFFKEDDWKNLRPVICKLMRSLINCIHKKNLLAVDDRKNVGNVLALLSWISKGIKYRVPDFGKEASAEASSRQVGLLSGFSRTADNPSLIDIAQNAVNYLLNSQVAVFDTRQLGKMVMQLGRMITAGDLGLEKSDNKPWIEPATLANKLVVFSKSSLIDQYKEKDHAQAQGYFNPVTLENLCEGLLVLFKKQVLVWANKEHETIAVKVANLITKIMASASTVDDHNRKQYNKFLQEAITNVPEELRQPFNEAMKKVNG
jgi:hypothetical protein